MASPQASPAPRRAPMYAAMARSHGRVLHPRGLRRNTPARGSLPPSRTGDEAPTEERGALPAPPKEQTGSPPRRPLEIAYTDAGGVPVSASHATPTSHHVQNRRPQELPILVYPIQERLRLPLPPWSRALPFLDTREQTALLLFFPLSVAGSSVRPTVALEHLNANFWVPRRASASMKVGRRRPVGEMEASSGWSPRPLRRPGSARSQSSGSPRNRRAARSPELKPQADPGRRSGRGLHPGDPPRRPHRRVLGVQPRLLGMEERFSRSWTVTPRSSRSNAERHRGGEGGLRLPQGPGHGQREEEQEGPSGSCVQEREGSRPWREGRPETCWSRCREWKDPEDDDPGRGPSEGEGLDSEC